MLWIIKVTSVHCANTLVLYRKKSFVIQHSTLNSSLHLLRSCTGGFFFIFCLKSIVYKLPELKRAGESTKASPKEYIYYRVPGLTHFPYPARDEEWHQELWVPRTVLTQQPRWQARAGSGLSATLRTLNWMKMLEKTQLLPAAKDLFSCLWFGGRSMRHRLLCFSLLCSFPGSSDSKKEELLLAGGRRKCASARLSPISAKRESEPIHT